ALGMRNDNLSTVSLSGIILLILKPFWLFDISFLLSFSAVLGIILLYPPIARRLKKIKYLGNAIAINVAVNIGILPLNLLFFGSFSVLTLPANIIIIPIISFVYIMLLIHLFCSFLLPFLVIFGAFSKTLIQFSSDIVKGIAETKWAVAEISLPLSMFIPYYTCCVIASDYSLIARQYKHIAVAVAVIAYSIIFLAASAYN
ncbi:MAG: hypothetical protein EOM87_05625, partial [Clostridia bacterium]|nr:hypothetical protein [Clostridia bacterium]